MSKERVPLHLPKPNPSCPLPPLHRLMGQDVNRSRGPHLDIHTVTQIYHHLIHCITFTFNMEADLELVRDHVPQSLVVDHSKEDVCLHLPTTHSTVHPLITKVAVASWGQRNSSCDGHTG